MSDPSNPHNECFPKSARLLKSPEFEQVYLSSAFAADNVLVVKAVYNDSKQTRLGLAVSRRVGNAVVRNRWKRVIREAFRKQQHDLPPGLDLVVRPKKGATCEYQSVFRSLGKLCVRVDKTLRRSAADPEKNPTNDSQSQR